MPNKNPSKPTPNPTKGTPPKPGTVPGPGKGPGKGKGPTPDGNDKPPQKLAVDVGAVAGVFTGALGWLAGATRVTA
jgi:hypothetical protein